MKKTTIVIPADEVVHYQRRFTIYDMVELGANLVVLTYSQKPDLSLYKDAVLMWGSPRQLHLLAESDYTGI